MNERALLDAIKGGDQEAFRQLYESKRDQLFWISYRLVGHSEDARDIVQTVFVTVWRKAHQYDPRYSLDAWLYKIAVNASIDHLRRQRTSVVFDERLFSPPLTETAEPHERKELERILHQSIHELPARQRAAFLLREVEGFTTEEAAFILRTSPSTVRSHLQQARAKLRRLLRSRYSRVFLVSKESREEKE